MTLYLVDGSVAVFEGTFEMFQAAGNWVSVSSRGPTEVEDGEKLLVSKSHIVAIFSKGS